MSYQPRYLPALVLASIGILLAGSLILHLLPGGGLFLMVLAAPGRVLFRMFLWMAWWAPVYFLLLAWISVSSERVTWSNIAVLNILTIPVVTIALLLQLVHGDMSVPLVAAAARSFTLRGGLLIVSLTLAVEAILLLQLPRLFPSAAVTTEDDLPAALPDPVVSSDEEITDEEEAIPVREISDTEEYSDNPEEVFHLSFGSEPGYEEDPEEMDTVEYDEEPEYQPVVRTVEREKKALRNYHIPVEGILNVYSNGRYWEIDEVTEHLAEQLKNILEQFGIEAEVTGIRKGPVITMFEILPAPGIKLARITNLADNIAMGLAASSVRIVAPIPGKHALGIEIPNKRRNTVSFGELMDSIEIDGENQNIPIALGKDIPGEAQIIDLTKTPHVLIAGATGSGKSVCVNSIICSILYRKNPQEVKLLLIDPKIVELKFYNDIPHLLTPVVTDPKRAFQALQWLLYEMERRYAVLDGMSVRDVVSFNRQIKRKKMAVEPLPYIVVVIDEFADLMATSGKELESTVARLAAMSRAVGIHLVLATQRPSTDVITGLIKANIPSRIAFAVAQKVDSRIILDAMGADKLLGQGDMLFTSSWDPFPVRIQGAYVSDEEVERIVDEVKKYGEPDYIDDEIFFEEEEELFSDEDLEDPLMEQAVEIVLSARKASASYLQRRLKVGYNRAARMVEEMERMGIVGPQNGSKPREVLSTA